MIIFIFTLTISITILLPLVAATMFRRRFYAPWWLFVVGAITFVGSQAYHIPLNNWLTDLGVIGPVDAAHAHFVRTAVLLGLSAGLSESIARAVMYAVLRRQNRARQVKAGIMIGIGHGGIEAMIFGGIMVAASISALWAIRDTDLATLNLTSEQLIVVQQQLTAFDKPLAAAIYPMIERILAMILHVAFSLLVWQAFEKRKIGYFLMTVLYHSVVDGLLVYAGPQVETTELLLLILAAMVLPGLFLLWHWWPREEKRPLHTHLPFRRETAVFGVALRKELMQQWRTKRVLVVVAVFLLFGLGSPLIANFTPQLLSNIEGAEQFADLIPTPSNVDALNQYLRNISQFGFIIAVLLGMGAVAGEKERGIAPMILSKPLPRWAFVLSKFSAQAIVYLGAFLLAALGAFYYTMLLFEPFQFWPFMLGNLLLLVWLLVFTAVSLLGSTIGRSTGAAAGIGLAGAVILLLAGSIPQWGALFFPSGLMTWASQLGLEPALSAAEVAVSPN
ncbi:MAG: YhfC family intramembrane metalloprotease, partial [Anaerolineales bacterium]|nr:YhfC family intramembrane metalloprotease [Anaerolineales bacterium]